MKEKRRFIGRNEKILSVVHTSAFKKQEGARGKEFVAEK